jgi:diguanylate cyclase (GGDEF)-like protein
MNKDNKLKKALFFRDLINPRRLLDRTPIDKTLFLAYASMSAPGIYALAIGFGFIQQLSNQSPNILNPHYAMLFLGICLAHLATLSFVVIRGNRLRKSTVRSELLWYAVAISWIISMLSTTFLAGSHFADGVLMLVMGFTLSLPLQRLHTLMVVFGAALIYFTLLTFVDLRGIFPSGQLFTSTPYVNGEPWAPWLYARIALGFGTFFLAYIASQTIASWQVREKEFRRLSNTDSLTLLSNRAHFLQRSALVFNQVNRRTDALACMILDLDHFKKINDTYGHHAGDKVLIAVADVLKQNARDYDEVSRLGGEEFAILMPTTTLDVAAQVATRIRERLEEKSIEVDGHILNVTTSIGVACYPDAGIQGIEDLLKKADIALYEAKRCGRNKVVVAGENDLSQFKSA